MKISYASDIHLEFGPILLDNEDNSDVLVLAGDIFVAEHLNHEGYQKTKIVEFFDSVNDQWDNIILVYGNHEYYEGKIGGVTDLLNKNVNMKNVRVLDPGHVVIGGVMFVGGTLWTNFNQNPVDMWAASRSMNDFYLIHNKSGSRFKPEDAAMIFEEHLEYITNILDERHPTVVVTHHAPSNISIQDCYKGDNISPAYFSHLDEFIMNNNNIHLWIHGHTHHCVDYMVGNTRVVSNQRGYAGRQRMADSFQLKTITL